MRYLGLMLCAAAVSFTAFAGAQTQPESVIATARPAVLLLHIDGAIGPASADYIERGLQRAVQQKNNLVVLQLDTPGGLDSSMRSIIKDILSSPIPVAAFVAPQGARAASAGTYILYAAHIAAMAPATTLGAATPVTVGLASPGGGLGHPESVGAAASGAPSSARAGPVPGDTMEAKRVSDAAAYIRSLALLRGRNAEWAERAVREAVSLPASEALAQKVVDVVAADVPDLLHQLDGRVVYNNAGSKMVLVTADAEVAKFDPDWRARLLAVIGEPSLALMLVMIGFYGLLLEFVSPGFVLPGVAGAVCLLIGLFGLQTLPFNYAGFALVLLGLSFFVAEAFVPSYGSLGLGGVVAFALGAVMLIDSDSSGFSVPRALIYTLALASLAFVVGVAIQAARTRRRPLVSGTSTMVGVVGEVMEACGVEGWARVHGEHWQVRGAQPLRLGEHVRVKRVDGLTLEVEGA